MNGQFKRNEESPLECDLLVADECSTVDVPLASQLLKAVASTTVDFVGDVGQLPSVGPGQVLAALIESGAVPVLVRLAEVFRQANASRIVRSAQQIKSGAVPVPVGKRRRVGFLFCAGR